MAPYSLQYILAHYFWPEPWMLRIETFKTTVINAVFGWVHFMPSFARWQSGVGGAASQLSRKATRNPATSFLTLLREKYNLSYIRSQRYSVRQYLGAAYGNWFDIEMALFE